MRIGILTGGGDAPGLNIAVYTLTKLLERKHEVYAIFHGWRGGILDKEVRRVTSKDLIDFAFAGGTFIRTSRTNPFKDEARVEVFARNLKELGLDVIVAIGGDDTLSAAAQTQARGGLANVVGVPKTIDNDVYGTDYTIGFDTAVNEAIKVTESFKTTLISHERIGVVEVMVGRLVGLPYSLDWPQWPTSSSYLRNPLIGMLSPIRLRRFIGIEDGPWSLPLRVLGNMVVPGMSLGTRDLAALVMNWHST